MDRSKVRGMRMPAGALAASAQLDQKQDAFKERIERQTAEFRAAIDFYRIDTPSEPRNASAPEASQGFAAPVPSR